MRDETTRIYSASKRSLQPATEPINRRASTHPSATSFNGGAGIRWPSALRTASRGSGPLQRASRAAQTLMVVGALLHSAAAAQTVTEDDRIDPPTSVGGKVGSSVAIDSYQRGVSKAWALVAGGIGVNGGGFRYERPDTDWIFVNSLSESNSYGPVAASNGVTAYGYTESETGFGNASYITRNDTRPLTVGFVGEVAAVDRFHPFLAIGLPDELGGQGKVLVLRFDTTTLRYELQETLHGTLGSRFGASLAFNDFGNMLIIGAPSAGQNGRVEAFVYDQKSDDWFSHFDIFPPALYDNQSAARFGASVDISGLTIAVGAPFANRVNSAPYIPAIDCGAVLTYTLQPFGGAALDQRFQGVQATDHLGTSVAVDQRTADYTLLVAGVPEHGTSEGAVRAYERVGEAGWTFRGQLVASDAGADDDLGHSVATYDGVIVAGAPGYDLDLRGISGSILDVGAVYVWESVGSMIFSGDFESGTLYPWSASP